MRSGNQQNIEIIFFFLTISGDQIKDNGLSFAVALRTNSSMYRSFQLIQQSISTNDSTASFKPAIQSYMI